MKTTYQDITDCIKDLIEVSDFIIIPGLGALVMQMEPAEISLSQNVIFPPRKKIIFNPVLKTSDGLLINALQQKMGIDYVLAETMVHQFTQSILLLLETKCRADIEDIGYFYKSSEGNILFESLIDLYDLSESFGLYPVHLIGTEADIQQNNFSENKRNRIISFNLDIKSIYKIAAVVIVVLFLLIYWKKSSHVNFYAGFSDMILGKRNASEVRIVHYTYPDFVGKYDALIKPTKDVKVELEETALVNSLNMHTIKSNIHRSGYEVVLGCFKIEQNARKLLKQLNSNGVKAELQWNELKKMYVVFIGNFDEKNKAFDYLVNLKNRLRIKDAWIREKEN